MVKKDVMAGQLIIFEGPDGVGKSTISREVQKRLQLYGENSDLLTFPGREEGTLGQLVYKIHHEPEKLGLTSLTGCSLQVLHIAAHLDSIESRIIPALAEGKTVLLDRYWWSTWVYGLLGGIEPGFLKTMIDLELNQWANIVPSIAVLVRRESPIDRNEPITYWRKLRSEYDRLARREHQEYPIIFLDNNGTLESSVDTVVHAIREITGTKPVSEPTQGTLEIESSREIPPDFTGLRGVSHISPVQPTVVYDTYWRFAAERQKIFFSRFAAELGPWTHDPILSRYRFTNAYRVSDRTSQYLIRRVIYRDDLPQTEREIFFRIVLFKMFNLIETWELLEDSLGPITFENYGFGKFEEILSHAIGSGRKIYSGAYIMPPGNRFFGHKEKHRNHLALIELMMADSLPEQLADARNMQEGYALLRKYPTIGDFLAYQLITDINYSEITNFSEMEFVVPGPGARAGLQKCFSDRGGLNEPELIKFVADRQEREFERLGLQFQSLWGRRLQLIDCQNLFCEVDKYARVRHPEIEGGSGRKRIKRLFSPNLTQPPVWYPPKWDLNEHVGEAPVISGTH